MLFLQNSELSKVSAILADQRLFYWWSGNLSTSCVLPFLKPEAGSVTKSTL
jgi:hypothetical protein